MSEKKLTIKDISPDFKPVGDRFDQKTLDFLIAIFPWMEDYLEKIEKESYERGQRDAFDYIQEMEHNKK